MQSGGWKSFWVALWTTLLVLLPLVGGTILLQQQQAKQRVEAAESQSGVAVQLPKASDRLTVLVCVAGEEPGFVLLYLNADQNCLNLLALPGELTVPFGTGEAALTECYAAAGPARCFQGLSQVLDLPEDGRYLAIAPATLAQVAKDFGALRVSFSGALTAEELEAVGQTGAVQDWTAESAHDFLRELDAAERLSPRTRAAARAAVWDAFFRQKLELLPAALPQALRQNSSSLLTDLTAGELYTLEETLEFLANNSAEVRSGALPGGWDGELYTVDESSRAAVQALFNVTPSEEQSPSASAP